MFVIPLELALRAAGGGAVGDGGEISGKKAFWKLAAMVRCKKGKPLLPQLWESVSLSLLG